MAKVLIIDDEADFREVIRTFLEIEGHEVVDAEDGEAGVIAARDNDPDLVITDILMPGMEGLEAIMKLMAMNPSIKIIAMSGGGRFQCDLYLDIARNFGAVAAIGKPFMARELIALVQEQLGNSGDSPQPQSKKKW